MEDNRFHSLFATRYSPLQHTAADQRFHMLDVLAATSSVTGPTPVARDIACGKEQVVAGADQAGVERTGSILRNSPALMPSASRRR